MKLKEWAISAGRWGALTRGQRLLRSPLVDELKYDSGTKALGRRLAKARQGLELKRNREAKCTSSKITMLSEGMLVNQRGSLKKQFLPEV